MGVGGGFVRVELFPGVVPRDRKSGVYVSLSMCQSVYTESVAILSNPGLLLHWCCPVSHRSA